MNNSKTIQSLETIEEKLKILLQNYAQKVAEIQELEAENKQLHLIIEEQKRDLKNFQNQDKISKIVTSVTVGEQGRNTELKLKINEYIKEIDKCIAHLKG